MADVSFHGGYSVSVVSNVPQVIEEMKKREKQAIKMATSQFHRLCVPYVRFDTGIMAHTAYSASSYKDGEIVWNTPYAAIAYFNETSNVNTTHNPNATARWADVAYAKNGNQLQALVAKIMKGE